MSTTKDDKISHEMGLVSCSHPLQKQISKVRKTFSDLYTLLVKYQNLSCSIKKLILEMQGLLQFFNKGYEQLQRSYSYLIIIIIRSVFEKVTHNHYTLKLHGMLLLNWIYGSNLNISTKQYNLNIINHSTYTLKEIGCQKQRGKSS